MSAEHYHFLVLGGGSAGYAAASLARDHVENVAIVDGSEHLGGLCILRGCMPSKTLLYSAEVLHLAQKGKEFGLNINRPSVDMPSLHQRKTNIIGEFADYRRSQLESERFHLHRETGKLVDEQTVELSNGTRLTADKILISTGSTVAVPDISGLKDIPFLTSDDILDLKAVPESVIILGGGVVACELSQFLTRIGTPVIQIQRSPYLLTGQPVDAAAVLAEALERDGVELHTETQIETIEPTENGVSVSFREGNRLVTRHAQYLFNALGRDPNTANLGLRKAGIELRDSGHIQTNEFQQTSLANVYAAGDCAGPHEIVHLAILQGECAARHALGLDAKPVAADRTLSVVFTDPQIATVGRSEAELREEFPETLRSAEYPFFDHGKSILMEARLGYVRLFSDGTNGKILRAECVGKDAGELIHSIAVAVSLGASVPDLLEAPWYHPTLSEIWTYPLEELTKEPDKSEVASNRLAAQSNENISPSDVVSQILSQDDW